MKERWLDDQRFFFILHRSSFILSSEEGPMAHLLQVGAGSGGMPVLDLVCRDPRITGVTLIEPDIYKPHNVERHFFSPSGVGEPKAELAARWLQERRPELKIRLFLCDLLDPKTQDAIEEEVKAADVGIC